MLNSCNFVGRLTDDPKLEETPNNKKYVKFTLAVPKKYNKKQANFIDCQCWGASANYISKYGKKGSIVVARNAEATTSIYNDKKYVTFQAESVELIGEQTSQESNNGEEQTKPKPQRSQVKEGQVITSTVVEVVKEEKEEEDLPF